MLEGISQVLKSVHAFQFFVVEQSLDLGVNPLGSREKECVDINQNLVFPNLEGDEITLKVKQGKRYFRSHEGYEHV